MPSHEYRCNLRTSVGLRRYGEKGCGLKFNQTVVKRLNDGGNA
jgi:hypothetical protein